MNKDTKKTLFVQISSTIHQINGVLLDLALDNQDLINKGLDSIITGLQNVKATINNDLNLVQATPVTSDIPAVIQAVITKGDSIFVKYADSHGVTSERVVDPIEVNSNSLLAWDNDKDDYRRFNLTGIVHVKLTGRPKTKQVTSA